MKVLSVGLILILKATHLRLEMELEDAQNYLTNESIPWKYLFWLKNGPEIAEYEYK